MSEAASVFEDTLDEFQSIEAILDPLLEWIEIDRPSFDEAYIGSNHYLNLVDVRYVGVTG